VNDLELAHELADAADAIAARGFAAETVEVITKADGSPVTATDLEVERALHALIGRHRPGDGVLGEEVGASGAGAPRRWVLDGVDGTHNFVARREEWGTLIALEDHGELVIGVVTSPAMGRRWWAERGGGAWTAALARGGLGAAERLAATPVASLAAATVVAMPPTSSCSGWLRAVGEAVERGGVRATAFGHSAVRVACGEADAAVHVMGGPWDIAAGVAIVEEAGGRFGDLYGGRRIDTGTAVFTNGQLFDEVVRRATAATALPEPTG
jgi:histidinol-phosphatase